MITDEIWQNAKNKLCKKYKDSGDLPGILKLIKDFEETTNKTKYKSDFRQFVRESNLEDFLLETEGSVFVSTIHQTKGREFDNVFLAFSRFPKMDDETRRTIYVAITRAKQNLYILYNGDYFEKISLENTQRTFDSNDYPAPGQINMHLSHKDVFLGYFASRKKEIDSLVSGKTLSVNGTGCFYDGRQILKFSSKFCGKIAELKTKNYIPVKATIRHVVFWQGKDKEEEVKIILPDIEFSKMNEEN